MMVATSMPMSECSVAHPGHIRVSLVSTTFMSEEDVPRKTTHDDFYCKTCAEYEILPLSLIFLYWFQELSS